mgnify:CR=1 FL=1
MPTNEYKSLEELRDEVNNLDWQLQANCIGIDSLLFIPSDSRGRDVSKNYNEAKKFCISCTVRAECLAYSIYNKMEGLWGGFTPQERKGLHKSVPVKYYFQKKDSKNGKKI